MLQYRQEALIPPGEGKMTIQRPAKKRKTFKSGLTVNLAVIIVLSCAAAGFLLYFGFGKIAFLEKNNWKIQLDFIVFGYLPIGLGVLILLTLLALLSKGLSQYIVITPQALAYQKGKFAFTETWEQLVYSASKESKKAFYRTITIGTKDKLVRIESIFFSKFETITEIIKVAKESRKTRMMDMDI
jgi:hypothetical protein